MSKYRSTSLMQCHSTLSMVDRALVVAFPPLHSGLKKIHFCLSIELDQSWFQKDQNWFSKRSLIMMQKWSENTTAHRSSSKPHSWCILTWIIHGSRSACVWLWPDPFSTRNEVFFETTRSWPWNSIACYGLDDGYAFKSRRGISSWKTSEHASTIFNRSKWQPKTLLKCLINLF